jgi:hypothetical protein
MKSRTIAYSIYDAARGITSIVTNSPFSCLNSKKSGFECISIGVAPSSTKEQFISASTSKGRLERLVQESDPGEA